MYNSKHIFRASSFFLSISLALGTSWVCLCVVYFRSLVRLFVLCFSTVFFGKFVTFSRNGTVFVILWFGSTVFSLALTSLRCAAVNIIVMILFHLTLSLLSRYIAMNPIDLTSKSVNRKREIEKAKKNHCAASSPCTEQDEQQTQRNLSARNLFLFILIA